MLQKHDPQIQCGLIALRGHRLLLGLTLLWAAVTEALAVKGLTSRGSYAKGRKVGNGENGREKRESRYLHTERNEREGTAERK